MREVRGEMDEYEEQRLASGRLEKRSHQVYTLFEVFETSLTF